MRVIAKRALREFWQSHPDARGPLEAWHREAMKADWRSPQAIKAQYRNASIVKGKRVAFNIAGNKYRLVVKINYDYGIAYVRFVGTHTEYDGVDVEQV
jgi:mRNA interferase HigB